MIDGQEAYTYPGSHVLKNKLDIKDFQELQRFERGITSIRMQELRERPIRGDYDLSHLRAIHRHIFKDVYEWAGEVRDVEIAKGPEGNRTLFAFTDQIQGVMADVQKTIKEANHLRGMDRGQFAGKMAEVFAAVNEAHPFREGNGRATREFLGQLAKEAGYELEWSKVDKQRWNDASREAVRGEGEPVKQVFYEIMTVERAAAFLQLPQREALARHPELDGAFKTVIDAKRDGQDLAAVRDQIFNTLNDGRFVRGNVSVEESQRVIDLSAVQRGLMVRSADQLGGTFRGEIVSVSTHHALMQAGDMIAVRYERANLQRDVQVGDKISIHYGQDKSMVYEAGKEPPRERGRDMQLELVKELVAPR